MAVPADFGLATGPGGGAGVTDCARDAAALGVMVCALSGGAAAVVAASATRAKRLCASDVTGGAHSFNSKLTHEALFRRGHNNAVADSRWHGARRRRQWSLDADRRRREAR